MRAVIGMAGCSRSLWNLAEELLWGFEQRVVFAFELGDIAGRTVEIGHDLTNSKRCPRCQWAVRNSLLCLRFAGEVLNVEGPVVDTPGSRTCSMALAPSLDIRIGLEM